MPTALIQNLEFNQPSPCLCDQPLPQIPVRSIGMMMKGKCGVRGWRSSHTAGQSSMSRGVWGAESPAYPPASVSPRVRPQHCQTHDPFTFKVLDHHMLCWFSSRSEVRQVQCLWSQICFVFLAERIAFLPSQLCGESRWATAQLHRFDPPVPLVWAQPILAETSPLSEDVAELTRPLKLGV